MGNLREAHAHIHWHARALSMPKLDACTSVSECLEILASSATKLQTNEWLLAAGARIEGWSERRWPTLSELDSAVRDRPCVIMSFDHHAVVANSRALKASRVVEAPPSAGVVVFDQHHEPTGVLLEAAAYQAWNAAPEPTRSQWQTMIPAALADLARHGFTQVHDLYAPAWLGPMLADIDRRGELPMSIHLFAPLDDIEAELERSRTYTTSRVHLKGAKLFADGTLNSRTAWMLHPYANPIPGLPTGKVIASPDQIRAAIARTARLNTGLAIHAIGDGAVRAVLDAAEAVASTEEFSASGVRIEHCELIDEADVPRFASLGVTASVQPCHLLADIEALNRHVPHRLERALPIRELIDSGLVPGQTLLFGSDTPVVRPDPQDSIQAAVERRRIGALTRDSIAPAQKITPEEAWACFGQ